jgi:micrococcal nuclease
MNLKLFILFLLIPFYNDSYTAKVISIKDGDTIEVLKDKKTIRIRLEGIDCPEKDQDFGQKAKQFTSDFCYNKEVTVKAKGTDRYGRTLAEISLPDGRILNQELIKEGFAWHYKKYSSDTTLANLEIKAKEHKKGLWQQVDATAPWEFRKQNRNKNNVLHWWSVYPKKKPMN